MVIVVMGVSGAGKTTIGLLLAEALGAEFAEGDAFHPAVNVEKMRRGEPLTDHDRSPWLVRLSEQIGIWLALGRSGVLACSALRQAYRDVLVGGRAGIHFVHLKGDVALIRARLESRRGHYMPASLLDSQVAALEEPEEAIAVDIAGTPQAIVEQVVARLRAAAGAPSAPPQR